MPKTLDIREPNETEIQYGIRKLQSVLGRAVIFDGTDWLEMTDKNAALQHARANGWKQAWLLTPSA